MFKIKHSMTAFTTTHKNHNRFTALFLGLPRSGGARRELVDRGRNTDHPVGCHSIRTNQCPPPPHPHYDSIYKSRKIRTQGHST